MSVCPACRNDIPEDSLFCGYCGFRLAPIPPEKHLSLSQELAVLSEPEAIVPLTRRKTESEELRGFIPERPEGARGRAADSSRVPPPYPAAPRQGREDRHAAPTGARGPARELRTLRPKPKLMLVEPGLEDTMPGAVDVLEDTSPTGAQPPPIPSQRHQAVAQPPPVPEQRRSARRFPIKVEVNYTSEHNFYTGFLENLSSGGLFVATHEPVVIGDLIDVTFSVPGLNRSCTAACEVRWLREYNPLHTDTEPGMGVKFVQIDPEAQAAIELFIRHREPIFFDDEF